MNVKETGRLVYLEGSNMRSTVAARDPLYQTFCYCGACTTEGSMFALQMMHKDWVRTRAEGNPKRRVGSTANGLKYRYLHFVIM